MKINNPPTNLRKTIALTGARSIAPRETPLKLAEQCSALRNKKRNRGFTLVEMLLVVTIIGILAALVIPKIAGTGERARVQAAIADIKGGIKTALDRYEVENGFYPKSLQDLVTRPNDAKNWTGPYLDEVPKDPWGNPYVYVYPGRNNPNSYDLYSIGPDGQDGTADDIGNWTK